MALRECSYCGRYVSESAAFRVKVGVGSDIVLCSEDEVKMLLHDLVGQLLERKRNG